MERYLKEFHSQLKKYEGSLVKVSAMKRLNRHAKEYLNKLAKAGVIEKVDWGWYYITPKQQPRNALEFLAKDKNFKVIIAQTAASFWNQDFIHRDSVSIAVNNLSYKKVLEVFAEKHGWEMDIKYDKHAENIKRRKFGSLLVEDREGAIIDCMKRWAFTDAIAVLTANKNVLSLKRLMSSSYWVRIPGTDVRVKQALEYATYHLGMKSGKAELRNDVIKEELDEAVEKVVELA